MGTETNCVWLPHEQLQTSTDLMFSWSMPIFWTLEIRSKNEYDKTPWMDHRNLKAGLESGAVPPAWDRVLSDWGLLWYSSLAAQVSWLLGPLAGCLQVCYLVMYFRFTSALHVGNRREHIVRVWGWSDNSTTHKWDCFGQMRIWSMVAQADDFRSILTNRCWSQSANNAEKDIRFCHTQLAAPNW